MDFSRSRLGGGPQMVKTYGRFKQRIVNRDTKGVQEFALLTSTRPILADIMDSSSDSSDFEEHTKPPLPSRKPLDAKSVVGKENADTRSKTVAKNGEPSGRRSRSKQPELDVEPKSKSASKERSKDRAGSTAKATRKTSLERKPRAARSMSVKKPALCDDDSADTATSGLPKDELCALDTDRTVEKVPVQRTRTRSTSSTANKPRTRTRKKAVPIPAPTELENDQVDYAEQIPDSVPSPKSSPIVPTRPIQTIHVSDAAPEPTVSLLDTQAPSVSDQQWTIEDRLAAVAQSPMSSGKVTRRKTSRVRRSAHSSSHSANVEKSSAVCESNNVDSEQSRIATQAPRVKCESEISRRLSQVVIKEATRTTVATEPSELQIYGAVAVEAADGADQPRVSLAEPSTIPPLVIASPEQTHTSPNPALVDASPLPEDDQDLDSEQSRQHFGTRAMRFKAPRNARAQTFEIDDITETCPEIPSTPRRDSTVRCEVTEETVNPVLTQQDTQEYESPQPIQPSKLQTPANASRNTMQTPTRSSRGNHFTSARPRESLADTHIIPKRSAHRLLDVPHSPLRTATPHRVVYSPTRAALQLTHSPKRKTISNISIPKLALEKTEDRHRASLPAMHRPLAKDPATSSTDPEIEETKVPFLPARRHVQKSHILAACGQTAPIDWATGGLQSCGIPLPSLDPSTPSDQLHEIESNAGLCKIGEATYSEVFSAQWRYVPRTRYDKFNSKKGAKGERLMQVALKIIPFGNSSVKSGTGESQTTLRDLYQEIGATLALSRLSERERGKLQEARMQVKMPLKPKERELGANFVKAFRVCICQGPLPDPLLRAWDRWKTEYPDLCENIRPDYYPPSQLFAVFVLEMGGETLENALVSTWKEARSIIRQLALSMALAERNNRFEHRDLHWGNIMVTRYSSNLTFLYQLPPTGSRLKSTLISIPSYKVRCTIIDYTLSRLHIDNDAKDATSKPATYDPSNNVFYVALKDESLFQGEGDIQFDVYRQMRTCANNNWEGFHPHTNVLWLTYVLQKILTTKSPAIRDELMAVAESKLGSAFENVSVDVKRAASQEVLRRWMREFAQCESSSQVLQCAMLDLYKS
ncbi:hypothetical protein GGH96_000063 [Coemansia sp. RSA 1972]|nr:hypothetical protein GGH96_000063 [Coemansia sp. RSA 1972]